MKAEFSYPETMNIRSYNPQTHGDIGQIKKAAQLLLEAKRPMVYAGGGVILSDACQTIDRTGALARCALYQHADGLGWLSGQRQTICRYARHARHLRSQHGMQNCDVLLAVGARFDDRVIGNVAHFNSVPRKIIHIDIDPASISKRVKVDVPIVGDVKHVLSDLLSVLNSSKQKPDAAALERLVETDRRVAQRNSLTYKNSSEVIKPQFVIEKLYEITSGDAFVTSDVGQHQMWAAQYYKFDKPRRWINSGGLGTMGFGLPAAMGVQLAHPGATVACVTGEGSIQMNIQELSTCKQYHAADQDHRAEQPLSGHGAPVAGVLPRQPLLGILHGCVARFCQAGRSLWPCRHSYRQTFRC